MVFQVQRLASTYMYVRLHSNLGICCVKGENFSTLVANCLATRNKEIVMTCQCF